MFTTSSAVASNSKASLKSSLVETHTLASSANSVVYQLNPICVLGSPLNVVIRRFGVLLGATSATVGFSSLSSISCANVATGENN